MPGVWLWTTGFERQLEPGLRAGLDLGLAGILARGSVLWVALRPVAPLHLIPCVLDGSAGSCLMTRAEEIIFWCANGPWQHLHGVKIWDRVQKS